MSNPNHALGSQFNFNGTTITEITEVSPPNLSADDLDTSTHNNTNGVRTYVKGMTEPGEINISGFATSDEFALLWDNMLTQGTSSEKSITVYVPTLPSASLFQCNGYVNSLEEEAPYEDLIGFSSTIKVTSAPSFTTVTHA